jgi:DNA-binding NarL/FixJ family response regulator
VNAPVKAELAKLADRTRQVIAEARNLASGLSLASLQSQGLTAALEELTINTQVSSKIHCALKCERPIPINDIARATHIYRIVQQAVHNAIKHGKPKNVFVDVTVKENQVMLSIRRILSGQVHVSQNMSQQILGTFGNKNATPEASRVRQLTDREFEVFQLAGQGLSSAQIGRRLHLSIKTVQAHRANIKVKLQIKTTPALISYAASWLAHQAAQRPS